MTRFTLGALTILVFGGIIVALVPAQDASHVRRPEQRSVYADVPRTHASEGVQLTQHLQSAGQRVTSDYRPVSHTEEQTATGSPSGGLTSTGPIMLLAANDASPAGGLRSVLTRRSTLADPPGEPDSPPQARLESPAELPQQPAPRAQPEVELPRVSERAPDTDTGSQQTLQAPLEPSSSTAQELPAPSTGSEPSYREQSTADGTQTSSRRTHRIASEPAQPPLVASKTVAAPRSTVPLASSDGSQAADTLKSSTGALLRVDTVGPEAVIIGEVAELSVRLSNLGATEAQNASVRITVPKNLELVSSDVEDGNARVQQEAISGSIVIWSIDRVPARAERRMALRVIPRTAAPLELSVEWSVAPISTIARIQVQQPRLEVALQGPEDLVFGDTKVFTVTVSNPGNGDTREVTLRLALGDESADTLQIGTVAAGVSRRYEVEVTARQAGSMTILAVAQGANDLRAEAQERIQVRRADLKLEALGSGMQFAGSVGTYQVRVANRGDAAADNVQAVMRLPSTAQYVQGLDDPRQQGNELAWSVGRLAAGEERTYRFFCQLNQEGNARFDITVRGTGGLETSSSLVTRVEAIADLKMTINDPKSPVPVGEEVLYEIQVVNRGTKAATQVQVVAQFSDGIEPVAVEGSPAELVPGQAVFETIARVEPGETIKLRVKAKADRDGNHVFRAELRCSDPEYRLVAEDTTTFFGDELLGSPVESNSNSPGDAAVESATRASLWGSETIAR